MQIPEPTDLALLALPRAQGGGRGEGWYPALLWGCQWAWSGQTDAWTDRSAVATFQEREGNLWSELDPVRAQAGWGVPHITLSFSTHPPPTHSEQAYGS